MQPIVFEPDNAHSDADAAFGVDRRPIWALALLGTVIAGVTYGCLAAIVVQFV